jgi:hypothetical protein
MFSRRIRVEIVSAEGEVRLCPIKWIDNFAMRNFTNDKVFDDTLPVEDGVLEVGKRVPMEELRAALEDWIRRKGWLKAGEGLRIGEN